MNADTTLRVLVSEIDKALDVLARIEEAICKFLAQTPNDPRQSTESALVITGYLSNYYTCLETAMLRISRHFENNLPASGWHRALLEKMTLEIPGIRPSVFDDSTAQDLAEILRFRYFSRYYFGLDYDWDRIRLVIAKFESTREPIRIAMRRFSDQLRSQFQPHGDTPSPSRKS
jgi:hypothetical protein